MGICKNDCAIKGSMSLQVSIRCAA